MDRMISEDDIKKIGGKLKALREKRGLSQQQFADELYWDLSTYQKIESGKVLITTDKAVQIHRKYCVDLNSFLDDDQYDDGESLMRVITTGSKEDSIKMLIRVLEYLICLLRGSLRK